MSVPQLVQPKRGYLANYLTIPPLIYPFQYNPTQVSDSKQLKWGKKDPMPAKEVSQAFAALRARSFGAIGKGFKATKEGLGRTFSHADLHRLESEGDRTLNFKFIIDGRERRPGEPERRRDESGHILGDLAILRSFVYPQFIDVLALLGSLGGGSRFAEAWFNEPPSAILVLGETSVEGFVTDLKITETLFNADLDPVRAEVEVTLIEKIDSISFVIDSVKRLGRTFYHTAYEDIGDVII
jgi:hypothetical protein